MKKTFKMKLASILGAAALLFAGSAMLNMQTVSAETHTLKLAGANIEMDTDTSLMFAVSTDIAYENVQLLVWDEAPAEYTVESANGEMKLTNPTTRVINDAEYAVFTKQLLAKQMTDTFYLCAYANVEGVEYYSEPIKYSILEYAYTKLGYTGEAATTKENLIPLIEAMLNYGAAAQTYANYKTDALATDDFVYVEVANATFADGFNYGLYKAGASVPVTIAEGYKLSINATLFEETAEGVQLKVPTGTADNFVINDTTSFIEESVVEEDVQEITQEVSITFSELGIGNAVDFTSYTPDNNVTLSASKDEGQNAPRYYDAGTAVRFYEGNTFTISAITKIKSIVLTFDSASYAMTNTSCNIANGTAMGLGQAEITIAPIDGMSSIVFTHMDGEPWRIQKVVVTVVEPDDTQKAKIDAAALTLDFNEIMGAATKTLPTVGTRYSSKITWALSEGANATLIDNVLTTNPEEDTAFTLTAMFTLNEATAEKEFEITLTHVDEGGDAVISEYVKVTSADEFTTGTYVLIVNSKNVTLSTFDGSWIKGSTLNAGNTIDKATGDALAITLEVSDSGVKIKIGTQYVKPKSGNNNGIQEGSYDWAYEFQEDGTIVFKGVGSDTTTLAYNVQNSGFRAYKNSTASSYPCYFTAYKLVG